MKKLLSLLLCCCFILFGTELTVYAESETYNSTVNGLSYHMSCSATTSKATCGITCPDAHNVEAVATVAFLLNDGTKYYTVRSNVDPGTSAFTSWNAGTGQTLQNAYCVGYVNNAYAHGIYIKP